ncbi:MAG: site-specific DNA-methyltransferase [Acidimicrobiaceae bacterium]|nr:site-specific DNA-methyltransferase [Acidimicrobiaceae bacterium]MYE75812.1 site-specific DNA-methyltransferase [Acidimicrobiaceae bacterium]MYH44409.1 site-specific DNA-methyltransferase [Acidimicrobiaceae bacterium]MYJ42014.1 site-specific DNA-methyltransferase [Acidimicrobiaceae bacterium]MYK74868.1 site-specific DNA-methyltransferase [Acidimicrobiaceae bacterium]
MARKKALNEPTPVEAITHSDTRTNIPTADAHDLVPPEVEEMVQITYPRDIRSPMLVWKGKEELDETDLQVDAPPLYIQEKIDPRVLIDNLRKTAEDDGPELTLFEAFDGLGELDLVEFYKHAANWSNRMILGDSLQVMASLAERERLRGRVQMVYIDPPYGIKFGSNWQVSARKREVKDGNTSHVSRDAEHIRAFRDTWELGIHSYLTYLRDRVSVSRDLLTDSGSLFVQIGDENVHLVRSVLDEVMGAENFVSMISFVTTSGFTQASALPRTGDYLLWYARNSDRLKSRPLWEEAPDRQGYRWLYFEDGTSRGLRKGETPDSVSGSVRLYTPGDLQSQGSAAEPQPYNFAGRQYLPGANSHWKASYPDGMDRLVWANRIHEARDSLRYRRFVDDFPYKARTNFWDDTGTGNFTDDKVYVVQTNTKVVERCILLATDPGDLVLDPTCGSGTTAFVAERWGRRWITVDSSRVALAVARQRLAGALHPYYILADTDAGRALEADLMGSDMPSVETSGDIRQGFVCQRIKRITLGSIASNPDIQEGMSQVEIDEAIARHADTEFLLDQPYEDKTRVRVTGPFTVESLSPHRNRTPAAESDRSHVSDDSNADFVGMIVENLRESGIQNGMRAERLEFDLVEPHAGAHIQAVGSRTAAGPDGISRAGICIGPQFGTVGAAFVKDAAREARADRSLDILCILAFAFDPQVLNSDEEYVAADESFDVAGMRSLGPVPVLLVRMNSDLLMGQELAAKAGGNLFTTFGEPDIKISVDGEDVTVELHGVDVYDPNTGMVRSDLTDKVALWMIDTDYDEESFFVRHCYFTGGQDPYKRLKTALKADINEEAWKSLYATVSRPFPKPSTGSIAVKVINDYGDEVVKVYEVA